jgi:hypothetical protein
VEQIFLDPTFLHKNDSQYFGSTRESVLKKYPFGTAPPDPRLEAGAGAVPNGPIILKQLNRSPRCQIIFVCRCGRTQHYRANSQCRDGYVAAQQMCGDADTKRAEMDGSRESMVGGGWSQWWLSAQCPRPRSGLCKCNQPGQMTKQIKSSKVYLKYVLNLLHRVECFESSQMTKRS